MSVTITVDQQSLHKTLAALKAKGEDSTRAASRALRMEAEFVMTEAKERTPVDTGMLRATGVVIQPEDFLINLFFGGPAAPYAEIVHEDYLAFHKVGGAGFLKSAVEEAIPRMGKRIAAAVKKALG